MMIWPLNLAMGKITNAEPMTGPISGKMNIEGIKKNIQVNIPFSMLVESYLDQFINYNLNPEIGLDARVLTTAHESDFIKVKEKLERAGLCITIHSPFIDLSAGSPDPEIRNVTKRRFEQVLGAASIFRPKAVVCHVGYDAKRYGFIREVWLENSLKTWRWMASRLREENIQLTLENVYEDGPDDIIILFEELKELEVKFCFDTGHHSAFGTASMDQWLERMGDYIGQLHLHDNNGAEDEHLGLGLGKIKFERLFLWLKEKYDSPPLITLEPHKKEDLWPSLKFLSEHWPWP